MRLCYTTIAEAGGQFVPEAWSKENGDCVVWGESASLTGLVVKHMLMNRLIVSYSWFVT